MKTLLITLALASALYAYTNWVTLRNSGKEKLDWQYTKCYYKGIYGGNWNISIVVNRSYCPYTIQYNPESGIWK